MNRVAEIRNAYNWHISKIADAFGFDRSTVRKRLKESSVKPIAKDGPSPLYALRDVGEALFAHAYHTGGEIDPDKLDPQSRRAWFQSENERLRFEQDQRHLVPDDEVARQMSVMVKKIANGLDTLTDRLERECGLPADTLEAVQSSVDALRESIHESASE